MKKLTLSVLMLGVMLFALSNVVSADETGGDLTNWIHINNVELNGQDQVTVEPGEMITAEVETEVHYSSWKSTKYIVEGQGEVCVDTPNHYSNGVYTESFSVNAPLSEGTYDFTVKVYKDDSCSSYWYGDSETLEEGIIVVEECEDCILEIINPITGEFYSGYEILVDWTAEGNNCPSTWDVFYGEKDPELGCNLESDTWGEGFLGNTHLTQLLWENVDDLEGDYCVKVESGCCIKDIVGPFCIDQTAPEVEVCVEGCCPDGIESDVQTPETETTIDVEYSDPDVGCEEECVLTCEINWDDGETTDCSEGEGQYTHQYADNGFYDVVVSVEDCGGNIGEATEEVEVENANPVCDGIDAPSDAAVGQPVIFTGYGSDVMADMPLIFNWDFGDEATAENENPTTHTFLSEGVYTVELVIEDKDGGVSNTCTHQIDVVEPVVLDNQEVAAFYELNANFGEDAGDVPNSFDTIITPTSDVTCNAVVSPVNMEIWGADNDCVVKWGDATARPKNVQQGTHLIVVRVSNTLGDYEYYTFDTTVYSWIIPLNEGWNLFSIPLVHETGDIEEIVLDQLYDCLPGGNEYPVWSYQFNGEESEWLSSRRTGYGDLDAVEAGHAYWINIEYNEDCQEGDAVLKGFGTQGAFGQRPEVDLPINHWSLIGKYGILGDAFADPEGVGYDAWYDNNEDALQSLDDVVDTMQVKRAYDNGAYWTSIATNNIYNNNGYWVWLGDDVGPETATYTPIDEHYEQN